MTTRNTFEINLTFKMEELKPEVFIDLIAEFLYCALEQNDPLELCYQAIEKVIGVDALETPWKNYQFNDKNVIPFLKDVSKAACEFVTLSEDITDSEIFFSLLAQLAALEAIQL